MQSEQHLREALRLTTSSDYQQRFHALEILTDGVEELLLLRQTRDGLLADLIHFAQTNHQAHHGDHSGTWLSCDRGSCPGLRRAVSRAQSATTPPAGAQEQP